MSSTSLWIVLVLVVVVGGGRAAQLEAVSHAGDTGHQVKPQMIEASSVVSSSVTQSSMLTRRKTTSNNMVHPEEQGGQVPLDLANESPHPATVVVEEPAETIAKSNGDDGSESVTTASPVTSTTTTTGALSPETSPSEFTKPKAVIGDTSSNKTNSNEAQTESSTETPATTTRTNTPTQQTSSLFDRERLISALSESFLGGNGNPDARTKFRPQQESSGLGRSTALSGNEPGSGPSPDSFGPVDDIFPVVFPRPASSGRENFTPLPTLDREHVSRHFIDRDNRNDEFEREGDELEETRTIGSQLGDSTTPSSISVRNRTPIPGRRPMLMKLTPQPIGEEEGGKRLSIGAQRSDRGFHRFPVDAAIGIEAKGDHGQIKRIPKTQPQEDHHTLVSLLNPHQQHFGLEPNGRRDHFSGLDPVFLDSNFVVENDDSPPQRRFSDPHQFSPTPPPHGLFFSTVGPDGIFINDPYLQFSPRQLPTFGQEATIYHRPTVTYPSFDNDLTINDERRRPLTRDHFFDFDGQSLSTFVTPREPNNKLPFGYGVNAQDNSYYDPVAGRPTILSHTNAHSDPYYNNYDQDRGDSHFLRPMSPRPTTHRDSQNPATFFNFVASTPVSDYLGVTPISPDHRISVSTPSPIHVSHYTTPHPQYSIHNDQPNFSPSSGYLPTTPSPIHVSHHTTPHPNYLIHDDQPNFSSSGYQPTTPYPFHGSSVTTIAPQRRRPAISSTLRPIISTPQRPKTRRPHDSNRGASRYTPPQIFQNPAVNSQYDSLAGSNSDYSTQYHSGEHLSNKVGQRPWLANNDLDSQNSSEEKEYSYHYTVHAPSSGDIKSAHETRLPHGGVVGGYSFLQPDGLTRQVSYTADKHSGFQANVEYLPPRPALQG